MFENFKKSKKIESIISTSTIEFIGEEIKRHFNSEILDYFIFTDKKIYSLDKNFENNIEILNQLKDSNLQGNNRSINLTANIIELSSKKSTLQIKLNHKKTLILLISNTFKSNEIELEILQKAIKNIEYILKIANEFSNTQKIYKKKYKLKKEKYFKKDNSPEELKTIFLANLSHEIKTPMNSIIGFTDLLQIPNLQADKVVNFASIANNNAKRLLNLLEDIIDLSKIETNNIKLKIEEISLINLLNEIFILNNNRLIKDKSKNISFNLSIPECLKESIIKADSIRMKQILSILLSNAINFTKEGSVILGIRLIENNEIEFYVKDTGCGIKEKNKENIFISFNQGGNFLKRNNEGSGLGLSIAKGLLKLYNIELKFKSKEGIGTTFFFKFPLVNKTIPNL